MKLKTEVLLCTYNGAAYVIPQLQSIVEQTTAVDRISVYDDRSSDDTVAVIGDFVSRLPAKTQRLFKVEVNPVNLGYAQNFAQAIAKATGDILFLCDQDDIWEADKVEVFVGLFEDGGPDMVFSDGVLIDEAGARLGRASMLESLGLNKRALSSFSEHAFELLTRRNYIPGSSAAVRRVAAQSALPLPCEMPHDYWIAIWCSLHNGIAAADRALYRYRQHDGNAIGGMRPGNAAYDLLGIWRQPNAPREKELQRWTAVTNRISALPCSERVAAARAKVEWLARVVPSNKKSPSRALEILKSAVNGSYRRYSGPDALLRDLVSLIS